MKKLIYMMVALTITACEGDTRFDYLQDRDEVPLVAINELGNLELVDSLKTSIKTGSMEYILNVLFSDKENRLANLSYSFVNGGGLDLVYEGEIVDRINVAGMSNVALKLVVNEDVQISNIIRFTVSDQAGKSASVELYLEVFNNLKPVAVLPEEAVLIGVYSSRQFEFDASGSYDKDRNQGGAISHYEWDINGNVFLWDKSSFQQEFAPGGYEVKLTVYDNDGQKSETVQKVYQIN